VRVFDASGRLVRTVLSTDLAPGTHDVRWDGRDDSGAPMSSGVYFVRAESGDRSVERKVNLLR
jgi:flagellar hook assembly protein FlgD